MRAPIHPGEHLKDELNELGLSASELARQLKVPTNRITGIIAGERSISAETAILLGHWFGTSAQFWMNLQTIYDLRLAERAIGKAVTKLPRLDRASA